MADPVHDEHVDHQADERGRRDARQHRKRNRQRERAAQFDEDRRTKQRHRTMREIDDARTAVDEDEAERRQRIDRAGTETQNGEDEQLVHLGRSLSTPALGRPMARLIPPGRTDPRPADSDIDSRR